VLRLTHSAVGSAVEEERTMGSTSGKKSNIFAAPVSGQSH
jgi:hypothetical protein